LLNIQVSTTKCVQKTLIAIFVTNLVTPKGAAELELMFKKFELRFRFRFQ
jgi:hypothetical protein